MNTSNSFNYVKIVSTLTTICIFFGIFYLPLFAFYKLWVPLFNVLISVFVFSIAWLLNRKSRYHLLAKILFILEPIRLLFINQLEIGISTYTYLYVGMVASFLIFDINKEKKYLILVLSLYVIAMLCLSLIFNIFPHLNPLGYKHDNIFLKAANWVFVGLLIIVATYRFVSIIAQQQRQLVADTDSMNQLNEELEKYIVEVSHSEQLLKKQKEALEKANQELATREEELRQNLGELHTTQESLLKEKEATLYKSTLFEIIAAANQMLLSERDWRSIVEVTLSSIGKTLKVDRGYFFERDDLSNKEIITVSQKLEWAKSGEFAVIDDPQMHHLPISLFEEFYSVIITNHIFQAMVQDLQEGELKQILLSQNIKSLVIAPIFIEGEFFGFIGWDDCQRNRTFTTDEVNAISSLAYSLSSALQNIKNDEQIRQKNQELAAREEELRQNLEELHTTQESLVKEKEAALELNRKLTGREVELKKSLEELNHVQEQMTLQNKVLVEARRKLDVQNQELIAREEELKQNLEELQSTQEQMRLAQEEAERNAMNARKIFEAAPVALFISKVSDRTIIQANESMAKLTKLPTYEVIGRTTLSFYNSEEQAKSVFSELIQTGKLQDKEIDIKLDDGSVRTVLVSAQVMTLNNEKVVVVGLNDITELKKVQAELRDLADNLTKKVEEQTEEIKRSFAQMVQNEKMAALGQLVAGVAHEINTPIGAIKASAENLQENLPDLVRKSLDTEVSDSFLPIFEKSIDYMLHEKTMLTSREERAYRKQITEILEQNEIENASDIAFSMVQIGLVKNIENFIPLFKQENYENILELLSRIGRMKVNIDTILLASNKTKKIVSALKSYTHRQSEQVLTPVNINESIETVLILYHNQIKHGVELITEFGEIPIIQGYADELSQVWTNIIVNALQATEYKGKLTIKTYLEDSHVIASISDNGPGIPPEIQDKIFEPFFTTKVQGEGTGLGLDICKKIIEQHNGNLWFTSEPGNTTFYISLPVAQASQN